MGKGRFVREMHDDHGDSAETLLSSLTEIIVERLLFQRLHIFYDLCLICWNNKSNAIMHCAVTGTSLESQVSTQVFKESSPPSTTYFI